MPDNGSGTYTVPTGTEAVSGEIISSSAYNSFLDDMETAMSNRLYKDGRTAWTGDQDANGNKITSLDNPTDPTDAVRKDYVDGLTWSTKLKAIADLTWAADRFAYFTGTTTAAIATVTSFARTLLADTSASAMRTTLGLGTLSTQNTVNNGDWSGTDLAIANGGTGASTAADARTALGIEIYDLYEGSDEDFTDYPLGTILNVDPGGTTPHRNATLALTLKAGGETFEISGGGTALSGTWKCRGVHGSNVIAQRTA